MLSRPLLAVLWAAMGAVAHPAMEGWTSDSTPSLPANSSQVADGGFEVVVVYVQPEHGCPVCVADPDPDPDYATHAPLPADGDEPAFSQSGTTVQLPPNTHWSVDTSSPANVIPIPPHSGSPLYYGHNDPSQAGYYGHLTYYFTSPSVNLDHCDHVTGIVCTETGCTITFGTSEAYQHAADHWSTDLILIAYTEGCSAYANGDRCYFLVNVLDLKDGLVIEVRGSFSHPDNLITKGETEWGWWNPRNGGSCTGPPGGYGPDANWSGPSAGSGPGTGSGSGGSTNPSGGSTNPNNPATPANNTVGFAAPKAACVPPVDTKYGLPTACLGDFFDQDLDDSLGYPADGSSAFDDFINFIAPGLEDYTTPPDPSDDDNLGDTFPQGRRSVPRRSAVLQKRYGLPCISCALKAVVTVIAHPIDTVIAVKQKVQEATSISGSINKDLSFRVPDPTSQEGSTLKDPSTKQVKSPWGDSILLKSFGTQPENAKRDEGKLTGYMNVFCVGCGVTGHANVAGRASWTPLGGFIQGQVELRTDIQFVFKLGIDAQLTYEKEFNNALLRLGLPGLTYGVVTIGPYIEVGSHVSLAAKAKGRLLAGAEMGLQNAHVLIDFINPANSQKDGWDPYFKPVFEADGEIMLSATLGLPVAFKCGLQVASFSKTVGIIDEPSLTGTAQVAASIGLADSGGLTAGFKDTDGCTGISTLISWRNKLFIDILGLKPIPLLDSGDKPLARGCIKLPGLPSTSATSATTETSAPTDAPTGATDPGTRTTEPTTTDHPDDTGVAPTPTPTGGEATPMTDPGSAEQTSTPAAPDGGDAPAPAAPTTPTGDTDDPAPADPAPSPPAEKRSINSRATNTTTGLVLDLTSKVKSNSTSLTYVSTSLPTIPYNGTGGYEFNLLTVSDASIIFVTCGNGAIYAVAADSPDNPACNPLWETYQDIIVADGADRVLHYYNNTMSTLGVSRLRVGDSDEVPVGGALVAFAADDTSGDDFFLAVDEEASVFFPVLCTYSDGGAAKMFLARDPDAGPLLLQSPDLQFTVTGGKVDECYVMPLLMGKYEEGGYYSYDDSDSSDDALELDI